MTEAQAYIIGWKAVMTGVDARGGLRFARDYANGDEAISYAWTAGALDAMEAEDDDKPEPACAGF
jgi:hypothetical protein